MAGLSFADTYFATHEKEKRKAFKDERKSARLKMVQKRSHFENDEKRNELVENERAIANEHVLRSVTYYIYIIYYIMYYNRSSHWALHKKFKRNVKHVLEL